MLGSDQSFLGLCFITEHNPSLLIVLSLCAQWRRSSLQWPAAHLVHLIHVIAHAGRWPSIQGRVINVLLVFARPACHRTLPGLDKTPPGSRAACSRHGCMDADLASNIALEGRVGNQAHQWSTHETAQASPQMLVTVLNMPACPLVMLSPLLNRQHRACCAAMAWGDTRHG